MTHQDAEFALQMFESAVGMDPAFALAHAAIANVCAETYYRSARTPAWIERAKAASLRASSLGGDSPEIRMAEAWILYAEEKYDEAVPRARQAIAMKADVEGGYHLLGRVLFAAGRYQEVADMAEEAVAAAGEDYNVYVPIGNSYEALGKKDAARNITLQNLQVLETHLQKYPEDARARVLLATYYAELGRADDALRELNLAMAMRSNAATVLYNAACAYCYLHRKAEAIDALKKAWERGWRDGSWARRDPDLALLHGDPEFERLYPEGAGA
jgi:non-specific serine/threonine protein kinase